MRKHIRSLIALSTLAVTTLVGLAIPASAAGFQPIKQAVSEKCVDVKGKSKSIHAIIQQYNCTGNSNQAWLKSPVPGGFQLINQNAGLCLDIRSDVANAPNGTTLQLYPCTDANGVMATVWRLKDPSGTVSQIQSVSSGRCIDDSGRVGNGVQIIIWDCQNNNINQLWRMP